MWLCQSASHRPPAFLALEHGVHLEIRHKPTGANHKVADEYADKGLRRQVLDWEPRRGLNWFVMTFDYPVRECLKGEKYSPTLIPSHNASTRMIVNLLVHFLKVLYFFLVGYAILTSRLDRSRDLMHWSSLRSLLTTYEKSTCSKSNLPCRSFAWWSHFTAPLLVESFSVLLSCASRDLTGIAKF